MRWTGFKSRRFAWMAGGTAGAVVIVGVAMLILRPGPLPAPDGLTPVALVKVVASDRFSALSDQRKAPYARALFALDPHNAAAMISSLTPDQQNAAFQNLGYLMITQTTNGYFEQKTSREKTAYLDRVLNWYDAIEQANKHQPRLSGVSSQEANQAADERRAMVKRWMTQGLAPSESARMAEFYKQLVLRRVARNLSMYGW